MSTLVGKWTWLVALMGAHPAWCVFPIKRGRKYPPLFENNLALASNSPTQVAEWGMKYPGCNWGLALARSHLIVMDVDRKLGKVGRLTFKRLQQIHGPLPQTFAVQTPNDGRHLYFHETNIVRHRMRLNAFGRDVDSPNYVLLPGSMLDGIGLYRIEDKSPVAPAPDWMAEYLAAFEGDDISQAPAVEQDTPDIIARAIHYLRNDARPSVQFQNGEFALLMTAAMLKDIGVSEFRAVELLNEHYNVPKGDGNRPYCEPLWDVGEGPTADRLDVKVHNAWRYLNQTQPGSRSPQVAFGDDPVDAAALNALAQWWRDRAAAIADGTMPSPKEQKAMIRKKP